MDWKPTVEWKKDKAGYRLEERLAVECVPLAMQTAGGWCAVGCSGEMEPVVIDGPDDGPLFLSFANLGRDGCSPILEIVKFANKYGLPVLPSENKIHEDDLLACVRQMRGAVSLLADGKGDAISFHIGHSPIFSLEPGTLDISLKARTLEGFLWLELLKAAQSRAVIKMCLSCNSYMIPKSRKREFCSNACRQRAHRETVADGVAA